MKIEELLKPVSNEFPCGEPGYVDPNFKVLEKDVNPEARMFQDKPKEPKWEDIEVRAGEMLTRTKDLRVAIWLTRAWVHREDAEKGGMRGLISGLQLIQELLTQYWECVQPCLDVEESNSPMRRLNALSEIGNRERLLRDVLEINITFYHAKLSLRDILVICSKSSNLENKSEYTQSQIEEIFLAEQNSQVVRNLHSFLIEVVDKIQGIQNIFAEKVDDAYKASRPDFTKLSAIIESIQKLCQSTVQSDQSTEKELLIIDSVAVPKSNSTSSSGEIRTREDVVQILEKASKFIERTEPTNPASLIIRFAQSLMTKNFVEIMEALPPENLKIFKKIVDSENKE